MATLREIAPPFAIDVIDTMVTIPGSATDWQRSFAGLIKDAASNDLRHPAGFLFRDLPEAAAGDDLVQWVLAEMDRWGVAQALIPVDDADDDIGRSAVLDHSERFHGVVLVDPNDGPEATRKVRRLHEAGVLVAVACFPAGCSPAVTLDDRRLYAIYAACCELDLPIMVNVGVPGPRLPMASQHPGALDQVCYDFAELTVVTRHGGEPWEDLLVKLMVKWPNLHYSTSAFAPKYYPSAIVDYANTRGTDRVLYAGYFPSGLSLERIFSELPDVGFRDHVWAPFLRDNARRVFGLD